MSPQPRSRVLAPFAVLSRGLARAVTRRPNAYEQRALAEIQAWKNPGRTFLGDVGAIVNAPGKLLSAILFNNPLGDLLGSAFKGIIGVLNDGASHTVSPEAVLRRYRQAGHRVQDLRHLHRLPLDALDTASAHLRSRYMAVATAEGIATGAAGGPLLAADVVALIALNLRAINETATFYGFDIQDPDEQVFATQVLLLASSPDAASKTATLSKLHQIAVAVAKRRTWRQLEGMALVPIFQEAAKALGTRLTKAKLAQVVPVAGAAIGGGYNAHFTGKVTLAARHLYRERHLARQLSDAVLVQPAS